VIDKQLGQIIKGVQDSSNPGIFYTKEYLARLRSRVMGLMTGVTSPTPLGKLMQNSVCSERLFMCKDWENSWWEYYQNI